MRCCRSPRTSAIMATTTGPRFLHEQLASLAAQTVPRWSSSSPTRLHLRHAPNRGSIRCIGSLSGADRRNAQRLGYGELLTACSATGQQIAFYDQDDIWRPEKLPVAQEALAASDASLFIHTAEVIDEAGRQLGKFDQGITRAVAVPPLHLNPWGAYYGFSMVFGEIFSLLWMRPSGPSQLRARQRPFA